MDDDFVVGEPALDEAVRVLEKDATFHLGLPCDNRLAELVCSLGREHVVEGKERRKYVELWVYMQRVCGSPFDAKRFYFVCTIPSVVVKLVEVGGRLWWLGWRVCAIRSGVRRTLRTCSHQDDAVRWKTARRRKRGHEY